jgi:RNA polymerase sigma-70 factor (sigma-E family)
MRRPRIKDAEPLQRRASAQRVYSVNTTAGTAGGSGMDALPAHEAGGRSVVTVTDLFRDHHLELVRLAVLMVGDKATAEDVVQDAFERLHRRWHRLREPANGLAYVRSSVMNGCRSVHRHAAVARKHAPRLAGSAYAIGVDAGSAADDRGELAAALRLLPARQREVVVLRYYLDLDVAEIAEVLRIAPGAVRSTCTRGLAALARELREDAR